MLAYFDELRTYRERAGLTITDLARHAKVDRATIGRAEKHRAVRKDILVKITNALNDLHYKANGGEVDFYSKLTSKSRYGESAQRGAA